MNDKERRFWMENNCYCMIVILRTIYYIIGKIDMSIANLNYLHISVIMVMIVV